MAAPDATAPERARDALVDIPARWRDFALELCDGAFDEFERATNLVDELVDARNPGEIGEIGANYLRDSLRIASEHARRAAELWSDAFAGLVAGAPKGTA